MSYVEKNLIPGEKLMYRTGVHWSVLFGSAIVAAIVAGAGIAILAYRNDIAGHGIPVNGTEIAGMALVAVAAIFFGYRVVKKNATEIAVTDRRVIIKTGMTSRRSLEIMLAKVESIGIDETLMGRMLGYGTVVIHGTGGTPEPFTKIAHPSEFRMAVQQQIDAARR
ncbi:MAG: PH domain-containing protein [Candidatus Acidoferrales bacterium]|nr:PH domain-containing protein [Candidatus Acidoferrales bacterium]